MPPELPTLALGISDASGVDGLEVRAPYHPRLVEGLKQIPAEGRGYDPDTKVWWVVARHRQDAEAALLSAFNEIQVLDPDGEDYLLTRDGRRAVQGRLAL